MGNEVNADRRRLVIVTGANQGGKSTFLRSVGLAQLMMQSGLFVGAEALRAEDCACVLTHYIREEDATMKSGKFDEELARMSDVVDHVEPGSMLLLNESFSATNERRALLVRAWRARYAVSACRAPPRRHAHLQASRGRAA